MFLHRILFTLICVSSISAKQIFQTRPTEATIKMEENAYSCFRSTNCELGPETKEKNNKCFKMVPEKYKQNFLNWSDEVSNGALKGNDLEESRDKFCGLSELTKRDSFYKVAQYIFDDFMMSCDTDSSLEYCDQVNKALKCVLDIYNENIPKGLCGIDVDIKNGRFM
ncbi:uncharacterized protein LOC129228164 [Uloborus diversus]|uniref:uncharacterized protein LOC129228164 n=1 Tax=Uloborus diversus TaxID=327109 RepID=UPI002409E971|nr:uncharacterized protein LOC129228164 [Uloborus diversus]